MMHPDVKRYLAAALGAALLEVAYWWEFRRSLEEKKYRKMLCSPRYWMCVVVMVLLGPAATLVWLDGEAASLRTCMLLGAAFPHIFKNAVAALVHRGQHLGPATTSEIGIRETAASDDRDEFRIRDYFVKNANS